MKDIDILFDVLGDVDDDLIPDISEIKESNRNTSFFYLFPAVAACAGLILAVNHFTNLKNPKNPEISNPIVSEVTTTYESTEITVLSSQTDIISEVSDVSLTDYSEKTTQTSSGTEIISSYNNSTRTETDRIIVTSAVPQESVTLTAQTDKIPVTSIIPPETVTHITDSEQNTTSEITTVSDITTPDSTQKTDEPVTTSEITAFKEIPEIKIGYYSESGSSKPMPSQKIALKCLSFCNSAEIFKVDAAVGDKVVLYNVDESTQHYRYSVHADERVIINQQNGGFEKEYAKEEWSNLDLKYKHSDYDSWHHETAEISFENCNAGDSGCIEFSFTLTTSDIPVGMAQLLYYYVGENGIGLGRNIDEAIDNYANYQNYTGR